MRRIMMFNRVSADGYFAAPDGNLNWVVPDVELDRSVAEAIARSDTDTILFGRRTYEMFAAFWPHALDDATTAQDPHNAGRRSPEMRAMAVMLNESAKIVFSRTLQEATWHNSRVLHALDPGEIGAMKQQPGKDMVIFGSGEVVSQLTEHGLIDDYQFVVCPVFLGDGKSLLHGLSTLEKLHLEESRAYPSGNVVLRYTRSR